MPGDTQVAAATVDLDPLDDQDPTVLASWTLTLVRTLDEAGCDGMALACQAGIDTDLFTVEGALTPAVGHLDALAARRRGDRRPVHRTPGRTQRAADDLPRPERRCGGERPVP